MNKEINELKEQFRTVKTKKELDEIDRKMSKLAENPDDFSKEMLKSIQETNQEIEEELLRDKLESILPSISVSYLAKTYFHKTPQWFYQKLNGNIVNNKPAKFTKDELKILTDALIDISDKIKQSVALVV